MAVISTLVMVGIFKGLAKIAAKCWGGDEVEAAVAAELAGALGKQTSERVISAIVDQFVGPAETHPEFRDLPDNERTAIVVELEASIAFAVDPDLLAHHRFDALEIVAAVHEKRRTDTRPTGHPRDTKSHSTQALEYYDHTFESAVVATITVAETVKGFHLANAKEVAARFCEVLDALEIASERQLQVAATLDSLKKTVQELRSHVHRERCRFLDRYFRAIRKTLDRMELFGLDVKEDSPAREQRLSVTFISLNLVGRDTECNSLPAPWTSVLASLEPGDGGRLLVRGDAGAGKSTLTKWTAIALAGAGIPRHQRSERTVTGDERKTLVAKRDSESEEVFHSGGDKALWKFKVPFLIRLRNCAGGALPEPKDYAKHVNKPVGDAPDGFIEWLLDKGRAIVILDGLDEVPEGEQQSRSDAAIRELLETYGDRGNFFIVTSRPLVKDPPWVKNFKFREASIAPMTDPERDALIHRWHESVAMHFPTEAEQREIRAKASRLIDQLNKTAPIARLATNPLLCAMLCAQCGVLNYTIPGSESLIIDQLCHALMWKREKEGAVPPTGTAWDDLEYDKRKPIAARIAHHMLTQRLPVLDQETATSKIDAALRDAGLTTPTAHSEAPRVLNTMAVRGGVLVAGEAGSIDFRHNTFKEYLAAGHFVGEQDAETLASDAVRTDYANVCRYAASYGQRKYTEELITRILKERDSQHARKLIALRMRVAAPSLSEGIRGELESIEASMFPPKSEEDIKAIAELGDDAIPNLEAVIAKHDISSPETHAELEACVRTLASMKSANSKTLLRRFAPSVHSRTLALMMKDAVDPLLTPALVKAYWNDRTAVFGPIDFPLGQHVGDEGLRGLIQNPSLEKKFTTLDLKGTKVTDAGLKELARADSGLKSLTTLNLSGTRVTDAWLKELARADSGLKSLTKLNLDSTQVTDAGLKELARADSGLKSLTTLNLSDTRVTDAGLKELARADSGLKSLTTLDLSNTQVPDAGLKELARADSGLKSLTTLNLTGTQVKDAGLKELARADSGLQGITELRIWNTKTTDESLIALCHPLTGVGQLTVLVPSKSQVTVAALKALALPLTGLKKITLLDLSHTATTDEGLKELARADSGLKSLTTLNLSGTRVTDAWLKELARADSGLKSLTKLNLDSTQVTDAGLKELARADSGLKSLTTLNLSNTQMTDAGLKELARADSGLKSLTTLNLGNTKVKDAGLKELARADSGLKSLTTLDLRVTQVTDAGRQLVKKRFPNLKLF